MACFSLLRSVLRVLAVAAFAFMTGARLSKPTMKLNHADISGVRVAFPRRLSALGCP